MRVSGRAAPSTGIHRRGLGSIHLLYASKNARPRWDAFRWVTQVGPPRDWNAQSCIPPLKASIQAALRGVTVAQNSQIWARLSSRRPTRRMPLRDT